MNPPREQDPASTPGPEVIAVIAHARKTLGGGLPELRRVLAAQGYPDPLWYEVKKSRKAPKRAQAALEQGEGTNVLYADGHVDWVAPENFKKVLDDSKKKAAEQPAVNDPGKAPDGNLK